MARDHARIYLAVWDDKDFRALEGYAQRMYFVLLSQPKLSYCGALDYMPSRLARLAADETLEGVHEAVETLHAAGFIVVDPETDEILIRSFIRHDGLLGQPNMVKAAVRARDDLLSKHLAEVVDQEFQRAYESTPDAKGWTGLEAFPELYEKVVGSPPQNPSQKGSQKGSRKGSKS